MLVTKINLVKWLEKKGSWKSAIAGLVPVRMQKRSVSVYFAMISLDHPRGRPSIYKVASRVDV